MTPSEFERANTWLCEIVETVIEGVGWRQEGDEQRAIGQGGLSINTSKCCWYSYAEGKGGYTALKLVEYLKNCDTKEATAWLDAFLKSHNGVGRTISDHDDLDRDVVGAEIAQEIIGQLVSPEGTPAETYLRSRGISIPIPEFVRYLPNARCGEGAVAALLFARDRVVGVQLGYLDPDGRKSTVIPARRRFMLEQAPDAAFVIPAPEGATDRLGDTLITEGLEDALSLAELGREMRIVGLPGIAALTHIPVRKDELIVVVRDGDAIGSPADKALQAGLNHLLLSGARVCVTKTPPCEDANSILCDGGKSALAQTIESTKPAELSLDGEIIRLSRLSEWDYELERKASAELYHVRVSELDKRVASKRPKTALEDEVDHDGQGKPVIVPEVEPWPEQIDGASLLDELTKGLAKYLIVDNHQRTAIALWVVFSHAFDAFDTAPKLVFTSPEKRAGKTHALDVLRRLVAKPLSTSAISPAALTRIIDRLCPTLLLDEFDAMLKGSPEMAETLRGYLNSGFNRALAVMIKSVPKANGGWEERAFSTWCPQVLAGIGKIPDTLSDRSICIEMKRKMRSETTAKLRSRDGEDLYILGRKAARWALDNLVALGDADPETPQSLNDRAADAWSPLLAIADLAGDVWPAKAREAAVVLSGGEVAETSATMLLSDIRDLFEERGGDRIKSQDVIAALVDLENRPWSEISRGKPLSQARLASLLRPFHVTPTKIRFGQGRGTPTAWGYYLSAFREPFDRYLSPLAPESADKTGTPEHMAENQGFQPDSEPEHTDPCSGLKTPENLSISAMCSGVPDETAEKGVRRKRRPGKPVSDPVERPNGHAKPNGHDEMDLDAAIIAYARDNPAKTISAIAKLFKQPKGVVTELLKGVRQ